MEDQYQHPLHGQLVLKRSLKNDTGYENIIKKWCKAKKAWQFYAKCRLDLNSSKQDVLEGSGCDTAKEAAIYMAVYLIENPPVPKQAGKVRARA